MNLPACLCLSGVDLLGRGKLRRRQALQATGLGFVASLTAILVGAGHTARADPLSGGAPVVDGVSVRILADDFQHEIATSYVVKDKGLVVLTSCSHRGVLNTVKQAQTATGVEKLHALVGGFHLVPPLSDDYVRQTVADLKALNPDYVVAAHCSGERFYDMARAEMPGRVVLANVGSRFSFGTKAAT